MEARFVGVGSRRLVVGAQTACRSRSSLRLGRTVASAAAVAVLAVAVSMVGAATAGASVGPRENSPGPALATSKPALAAALSCPQGVRGDRDPVLLVPGAGGNPITAFGAGLEPLLRAHHYPVCGVTLPDGAFGDIQVEAEYVVASIRSIAARSGRPVSVITVSQGGGVSRWALKWWPDLRSLVGDVIGLAPVSHGAAALAGLCGGPCAPATRQQLPDSRFLRALNRGDETPGRLSYSVISSRADAVGPPSTSNLEGERDDSNSVIQAICPGRDLDHGHIQYDAVAVALVLDALRHDGPARAARVPKATCAKTYAEGIDPAAVEHDIAAGLAYFAANYGRAGLTETEPALKHYATRPAPRPKATLRIHPRRLRPGHRTAVVLRAIGAAGQKRWPLARARIEIAGRKAITNGHGRAALRLRVRRPGSLRVRLVAPGLAPGARQLRVAGGEIGR